LSTSAYISDNPQALSHAIQLLRNALVQTDDRSFHIWLGQALTNLAESGAASDPVSLLEQAIEQQTTASSNYDLAWDYCYLALAYQKAKATSEMHAAVSRCRSLIDDLQAADQTQLRQLIGDLR
jgi:predicted Zn-dependent protease